LSLDRGA